jgi:hypothetical protein
MNGNTESKRRRFTLQFKKDTVRLYLKFCNRLTDKTMIFMNNLLLLNHDESDEKYYTINKVANQKKISQVVHLLL